jgi:hypothetical protein
VIPSGTCILSNEAISNYSELTLREAVFLVLSPALLIT